jgi:hypothetical protein
LVSTLIVNEKCDFFPQVCDSTLAVGVVIEVEEEVNMDGLSAEIKAGLQAKAGKGKVTKIESIAKKEKLVAYEAQVVTNGKSPRYKLDPMGSLWTMKSRNRLRRGQASRRSSSLAQTYRGLRTANSEITMIGVA